VGEAALAEPSLKGSHLAEPLGLNPTSAMPRELHGP
jgi:hypothetical protein